MQRPTLETAWPLTCQGDTSATCRPPQAALTRGPPPGPMDSSSPTRLVMMRLWLPLQTIIKSVFLLYPITIISERECKVSSLWCTNSRIFLLFTMWGRDSFFIYTYLPPRQSVLFVQPPNCEVIQTLCQMKTTINIFLKTSFFNLDFYFLIKTFDNLELLSYFESFNEISFFLE